MSSKAYSNPIDDAIVTPACKRCRLLDLPAELRNHIYHYAVVDEEAPRLIPDYPSCRVDEPPLSFTSKRIRQEVLPIFYGSNQFQLWDSSVTTQMLSRMALEKLKLLKTVFAFRSPDVGLSEFYTTRAQRKGTWKEHVESKVEGLITLEGGTIVDTTLFCPALLSHGNSVAWIKVGDLPLFKAENVYGVEQWSRKVGTTAKLALPVRSRAEKLAASTRKNRKERRPLESRRMGDFPVLIMGIEKPQE